MTAPANNNFADAIVLSGALPITRTNDTNVDATLEVDEPTLINYGQAIPAEEYDGIEKSVWYAWACGTTGTYSLRIDTDFDSVLSMYHGGTAFADLDRLEQSEMVFESPYYEVVYFEGTASQTYYFQVAGMDGASGDIDLELATFVRPANDAFANAITMSGNSDSESGSNVGASLQASEPSEVATYFRTGKTVWYKWTAPGIRSTTLTLTRSGRWSTENYSDSALAVYTGASVGSLSEVVGVTTAGSATFTSAAGTTYYFQVGSEPGDAILEGSFTLALSTVADNDYFPDATLITLSGGSATVTDSNVGETTESGEPLTFATFGFSGTVSNTVWWQWTADADGVATFDTFGSDFDTTAAVFTGGSVSGLTAIAFNDDYEGGTVTIDQSEIAWAAQDNTTYYLQVASAGTASGSITAHLEFDPYEAGGSADPAWDSGTASAYRVELRALNSAGFAVTTSSVELVTFAINWRLNGPGAFDGTGVVGVTQADASNVGARELIVYKGSTAIWGGYLSFFDVDEDTKQVRLGGEGYFSRARSRLMRGNQIYKPVTNSGVAWKADQIAWDIIDQAQGATYGDMGWVYGGHSGTRKDCKRVYYGVDRTNVGEAIEALAREGYFDFAVDVRGTPVEDDVAQFRTWAERGSDLSATINLSSSNAMTLNYSLSSSDMATVIDVFGAVEGCRGVAATDDANMATYGRLEARPIDMETDEQDEVDDTAAEYIDQHSVPAKSATVTYLEGVGPDLTDYDLGDTIRVSPGDGYLAYFDGRVIGRELAVEAGRAVITVEVER